MSRIPHRLLSRLWLPGGRPTRRAMLKGLLGTGLVMLPLPWLELLAPRRALADDAVYPVRFGVWFWGNGVQKDTWAPATTGANWTVPDDWQLAPLLLR